MSNEIFYEQLLFLMPYKENTNKGFKERLKNALDIYQGLTSGLHVSSQTLTDIQQICKKIYEIVSMSLKGQHSTAYFRLQHLIEGYEEHKWPRINLTELTMEIEAHTDFYRIRQMPYVFDVAPKELFHIPYDKRGIVKTQRYSISGYPCLYLGNSVYACWEELRRPPMNECAVSRFQNTTPLKLVDLTLSTIDKTKSEEYLKVIPLIISCMIPVANDSDTYKPEYILPQLLFEWLLKRYKPKSSFSFEGIAYTSTHLNGDFDFPSEKFVNFAIPVKNIIKGDLYCKILREQFELTKPTASNLEKMKIGRGVVFGSDDSDDSYEDSDFGLVEARLKRFPLVKIDRRGNINTCRS